MFSTFTSNRSFLFRTGVLCARVVPLLRQGKSLTAREGLCLVEADHFLSRMMEVHRCVTLQTMRPETEAISEFLSIREVIAANAWRFPDSSPACFEKLLLPLRGLLKGEEVAAEELEKAGAFFKAMADSLLGVLQDGGPDEED